jgi:short-subunit dehydrogenase
VINRKKIVLITGANGSLGYQLSTIFLKNNYNLILHSRKKNKKILSLKKNYKKKVKFFYGDLENKKKIKMLAKLAAKESVNILINNAGMYLNRPFGKIKIKNIYQIFEVNFFSNICLFSFLLKKKIKKLLIVNINSLAGISGSPNESIYAASKHALRGFYDSISYEKEMKNFSFLNIFSGAFQSKISKKRLDYKKLMNPKEISEVILQSSKDYNSLKIQNIFLKRKNY